MISPPPARPVIGYAGRACLAVAAFAIAACAGGRGEAPTPGGHETGITVQPLAAFHPPVFTEVRSGDTIESVCRRLAGEEWVLWRDALSREIDPRRIPIGLELHGVRSPGGCLEQLRVVLDLRSEITLWRAGETVSSERIDRPVESDAVRLAGRIDSSLFGAVETAGGNPELAVRLAEVFQWDIDFFRDLRTGDSFVVVVDRQEVDGAFYRFGTIFLARFVNDGRALDAVAYPDEDGRVGFYDTEGRTLRKQFLRSPLRFSRVTSRFSMRRYHPVLKRTMPHYGVDYGAPVGTPVQVTADGVVTFVGRNGGGGNMVRVRHPNGFETNYLHLSRYGRGIRKGVRVQQGQVVGYVGATGLASGPHLDYRVKLSGRWVNPLTISSPPVKPLEGERLQRFLAHSLAALELLEGRAPPEGASG